MSPADRPLHTADPASTTPESDAAALADWIETEPVPALEQYRRELADLAAQGQPDTAPVTDRLVDVIEALHAAGGVLRERDDDVLPDALAAVLARCTADIQSAQEAVARSRRLVERGRIRYERQPGSDPAGSGPPPPSGDDVPDA
ncbi:hypothetical protein AB0L40_20625 [Patulibacter sp. NPDC049589]|uniref:hypothetical protein n=1 Tax=Patulibacter sp. NPDC049589 TaxID=3154731 RepID=UPI0034364973